MRNGHKAICASLPKFVGVSSPHHLCPASLSEGPAAEGGREVSAPAWIGQPVEEEDLGSAHWPVSVAAGWEVGGENAYKFRQQGRNRFMPISR